MPLKLYDWFSEMTARSEEHTSELQSRFDLVCRLLLEKKKHFDCTGTLRRVSQSGVALCLPPRSKASGAATARLRLGVIMAVALLDRCATRSAVTPFHK